MTPYKARCIGGPRDGKTITTKCEPRDGDEYRCGSHKVIHLYRYSFTHIAWLHAACLEDTTIREILHGMIEKLDMKGGE